ncbi:MAG TPA: RNA methyltransferase [Pirellulaceae bacterium]|nr:RNA methyltransferase [Pirellulaceae bacterium]
MKITSKHNPHFKSALKLKASRGRRRSARFVIYGWREIQIALRSPLATSIVELFYCSEILDASQWRELEAAANRLPARLLELERPLFEQLAFGDRLDGVVAVAESDVRGLDRLVVPDDGLVVVVESLEKPGNLGAVARVCDGGRVAALIAASPRADFFHPYAIRASLGAVFTLPVATADTEGVVTWLQSHRFQVRIATPRPDAVPYFDSDLTGKLAIVLGAESQGLSEVWFQSGAQPVRLPMCGQVDSLNISTAAAVLVYDALRQRELQAQRDRGQDSFLGKG